MTSTLPCSKYLRGLIKEKGGLKKYLQKKKNRERKYIIPLVNVKGLLICQNVCTKFSNNFPKLIGQTDCR